MTSWYIANVGYLLSHLHAEIWRFYVDDDNNNDRTNNVTIPLVHVPRVITTVYAQIVAMGFYLTLCVTRGLQGYIIL